MKVAEWQGLRGIRVLIGVGLGCLGLNFADLQAEPVDFLPQISAAAQRAERECNDLMHDNADEYVSCLDAVGAAVKGKSPDATAKRLGTAYFGWVGATRWGRVSLPGSDEAALRYYLRFQPLQQKLKITDQDLCRSIAGDCKERLAQLAEIKKVAAAKQAAARPVPKPGAVSSKSSSSK